MNFSNTSFHKNATSIEPVAHALVRAASRLVSMPVIVEP
jgi:hypothetical protein